VHPEDRASGAKGSAGCAPSEAAGDRAPAGGPGKILKSRVWGKVSGGSSLPLFVEIPEFRYNAV